MSVKKNNILEDIIPLIEEDRREEVEKIATLLMGYIPKIIIDRDFQRELKSQIIHKKSSHFSRLSYIRSYAFISSLGIFCTVFIAAIGVWRFWEGSQMKGEEYVTPVIVSDNTMYSEEKAMRFSSITSNTGITENTDHTQSKKTFSPPASQSREVSAIQDAMADIESDLFESLESINDSQLSTPKQTAPEISLLRMTESSISPSGSQFANTQETAEPIRAMSPPPLSTLLQNDRVTSLLPEYPSSMKIYIKPDIWSDNEAQSRSGSGLMSRDLQTEKITVISKRVESLTQNSSLKSSTITYKPMKKILKDPSVLYYLVPSLEILLENGENYSIPLIRGYR